MTTRTFTIDELDDFTTADEVLDNEVGSGRWSTHHEIVFRADDDKLYVVCTEEGATEYQDYSGSDRYPDYVYVEDGDDFVECDQVEVYEELVPAKKWRKVS